MPFIALVLTDVTSLGTGGNIVQSLGYCSREQWCHDDDLELLSGVCSLNTTYNPSCFEHIEISAIAKWPFGP